MSYVIDRRQALHDTELVVVLGIRHGGGRSRLVLRDGSLLITLTRPRTLRKRLQEEPNANIVFTSRSR